MLFNIKNIYRNFYFELFRVIFGGFIMKCGNELRWIFESLRKLDF